MIVDSVLSMPLAQRLAATVVWLAGGPTAFWEVDLLPDRSSVEANSH
jgi:hypothetical protein